MLAGGGGGVVQAGLSFLVQKLPLLAFLLEKGKHNLQLPRRFTARGGGNTAHTWSATPPPMERFLHTQQQVSVAPLPCHPHLGASLV